jgi:hypothetical protein
MPDHPLLPGKFVPYWSYLKVSRARIGSDEKKVSQAKDDDPGNPTISFRGEKRTNQTHRSTTDPESMLYRKPRAERPGCALGRTF